MTWIAKRQVKVIRAGRAIILPPGTPVPEASTWRNASLWCTWSDKELETAATVNTASNKTGKYANMSITQLRDLAKKAQLLKKDDSTDIMKARDSELIVLIESVDFPEEEKEPKKPIVTKVVEEEPRNYSAIHIKELRKMAQVVMDKNGDEKKIDKYTKSKLISIIKSVKE